MKKKPKPIPKELFESSAPIARSGFFTQLRLERGRVDSFEHYPFCLPSIRSLDSLPLHPKVTYFVGENGSGKSTLLEALAVKMGINAEGGTIEFDFATRESHSELHEYLTLSRPPAAWQRPADLFFLRAESFYNVATEIEDLPGEIRAYGGKSLHEQSHGESFFALISERFQNNGVYLLDEPEAALSPSRQMSMLTILHNLITANCQFIIATHSPIVLAYPDAFIYMFSEKGIQRVTYEEAENVRVTRDFLNRREQMLKILLSDED